MTMIEQIDKLTEPQKRVLGCIAINRDGMHHPKTLAVLERQGLIESYDEIIGGVHVKRWFVPIQVHIVWCEWCSMQPAETQE